jgi:hypothetical protein
VAALLSASCETTRKAKPIVKAKPTNLTPFLEDFENMTMTQGRGPFHAYWLGATHEQILQSSKRTEIYIAPVETQFLRPIGKAMAARQHKRWAKDRPVSQVATQIRAEFVSAFMSSANPRYVAVDSPTTDSVTLRLSLVELDPTSVTGNVAKKAASVVLTPAAGAAGGFTKGRIAIEGQLRDTEGNYLLLQFADREKDKMTFWTARDFKPYGHATVAIKEWAAQFEELTRNPRWREMGDSRAWTLRPW